MNTHPVQCTTSLFHEDVGGISCSTAGKCDRLVIYRSFFVEQNDKTLEVWGNNELVGVYNNVIRGRKTDKDVKKDNDMKKR